MTTHQSLIDDWLKRNGAPRRFEPQAMSGMSSIKQFLLDRDIEVTGSHVRNGGIMTVRKIGKSGKPRKMKLKEFLRYVDEMRIAEGLEPFNPENRK